MKYRLSWLQLVFGPWACLGALGLAILGWPLFSIIALVGGSAIEAALARRQVLKEVKEQFDDADSVGDHPHVIAHSFGTYLLGKLLRHRHHTEVDKAVLAGCVLPQSFPWAALSRGATLAFQAVRNEVGRSDIVVFLAYSIRRLIPGFGAAGLYGFADDTHFVHTVTDVSSGCGPCRDCEKCLETARVHNFVSDYDHGEVLEGIGHCRRFWLPFFWGLDPYDFDLFVKCCLVAAKHEQDRDSPLALADAELRERPWKWAWNCAGRTGEGAKLLTELIQEWLKAEKKTAGRGPGELDEWVGRAVRLVWRSVSRAAEEMRKEPDSRDPKVAGLLYPHRAVGHAVSRFWDAGGDE